MTECNFLCPRMHKCDDKCYHFNNGYICKHIHWVHSLSHIQQLGNPQTESIVTEGYPVTDNENYQESVDNADDEYTSCLVELGGTQIFKTEWYFIKYHSINNYCGI